MKLSIILKQFIYINALFVYAIYVIYNILIQYIMLYMYVQHEDHNRHGAGKSLL